jgi:hypothetical protein
MNPEKTKAGILFLTKAPGLRLIGVATTIEPRITFLNSIVKAGVPKVPNVSGIAPVAWGVLRKKLRALYATYSPTLQDPQWGLYPDRNNKCGETGTKRGRLRGGEKSLPCHHSKKVHP